MSLLPKELIKEILRKGNFNSAADIQEALKRYTQLTLSYDRHIYFI